MAKLSLSLDERSQRNGMQLIRLKITNKGTNAFAGTGVYVEPEYFVKYSLYDPIRGKAYMAAEKREQVRLFVKKFEDVMASMDSIELDQMMAKEIKSLALEPVEKKIVQAVDDSGDFLAWYDEYAESRRTEKTRESYEYGAKVLHEYCASLRMRTLTFDQIDYARLADFARWLTANGKGDATRHMLESYVRAAYKEAQKRHMVSREHDPYLDYSIRPIPTKEIECLTREEMRALMNADLKKKGHQWARDMALASFYLCGANLLDLYEMPKEKKGEAVFVRHKVDGHWQIPQHIRIEPELRTLIDRYGSDTHMLHFKGLYANYDTFRHKISHRLEEISDEIGFKVNMAKVRRTWATLAGELECPEVVIDRSMGHVAKTVNGRFYEKYDWSRTAKWNRRVIDYVLSA